jgi:preprotein translocase subunit SecG
MSIVVTLLAVLLVALCLLMLLIILMQRPKQEGLGAAFGGGVMDGVLGSGTTNFLQKGTVYMAVSYFVVTLTLAVLHARTSDARSLQGRNLEVAEKTMTGTEDDQPDAEEPVPGTEEPAPGSEEPAPSTEEPAPSTEEPVPSTEQSKPGE